jgi:hypothetical protein
LVLLVEHLLVFLLLLFLLLFFPNIFFLGSPDMLSLLDFEQLFDHALFDHLIQPLVVNFFPEDFILSHSLLDLERQLVDVLGGIVILSSKRLQNIAVCQVEVALLHLLEVHRRRSVDQIVLKVVALILS